MHLFFIAVPFPSLSQSPLKSLDELKNAEIVFSKEAEGAEMTFSPHDSSYNNDVPDEVIFYEPTFSLLIIFLWSYAYGI